MEFFDKYLSLFVAPLCTLLGTWLGYKLSQKQRRQDDKARELKKTREAFLYILCIISAQMNNLILFAETLASCAHELIKDGQLIMFHEVEVTALDYKIVSPVLALLPNISVQLSSVFTTLTSLNSMVLVHHNYLQSDRYELSCSPLRTVKRYRQLLEAVLISLSKLDQMHLSINSRYKKVIMEALELSCDDQIPKQHYLIKKDGYDQETLDEIENVLQQLTKYEEKVKSASAA